MEPAAWLKVVTKFLGLAALWGGMGGRSRASGSESSELDDDDELESESLDDVLDDEDPTLMISVISGMTGASTPLSLSLSIFESVSDSSDDDLYGGSLSVELSDGYFAAFFPG